MSDQEMTKEQALEKFTEIKEAYDTVATEVKDLREDAEPETRLSFLEKQVALLKELNDFKKKHNL